MVRVNARSAILALCLVITAAGCSTPEVDEAGTSRGPITFVDGRDTTSGRRVEELVKRWNAARGYNERVTFVEMPTSTDEHRAQLVARAQDLAGVRDRPAFQSQCYDVMMLDVVWTAAFAEAGYLERLDPREFHTGRFLPQSLQAATFEDRLWAIPGRADAGLLYYRKDLLAAAGKSPPTTWPELIDLAKTVAPRYGVDGYVSQFRRYEGLTANAMEAVWAHGGDALPEGGPEAAINAPAARAGIGMLATGFADGWIPKAARDFDEEGSRQAFQDGKALFLRNWAYAYARLAAADSSVADKFGVTSLPGSSALGGWNLAVSRCSAHQQTAREFIAFYTGDENQRELFLHAGMAPTVRALYGDPDLRARLPYLDVLGASVKAARNRPASAHYDQLSSVMQEYLHSALDSPTRTAAVLDRLAEEMAAAVKGR